VIVGEDRSSGSGSGEDKRLMDGARWLARYLGVAAGVAGGIRGPESEGLRACLRFRWPLLTIGALVLPRWIYCRLAARVAGWLDGHGPGPGWLRQWSLA